MRETPLDRERKPERQREKATERASQTDRQADRLADRQADRQTDRPEQERARARTSRETKRKTILRERLWLGGRVCVACVRSSRLCERETHTDVHVLVEDDGLIHTYVSKYAYINISVNICATHT